MVSFEDEDNSSGDEGVTRSESIASEYVYQKPVEEKKSWDKYVTTRESGGSASEKHTDFIQKGSVVMKLITIFVTFVGVLMAGVISKGALLFIIAQVKH